MMLLEQQSLSQRDRETQTHTGKLDNSWSEKKNNSTNLRQRIGIMINYMVLRVELSNGVYVQ